MRRSASGDCGEKGEDAAAPGRLRICKTNLSHERVIFDCIVCLNRQSYLTFPDRVQRRNSFEGHVSTFIYTNEIVERD